MAETSNHPEAGALANTYARALYELAAGEGSAAEAAHELAQIDALLDDQPDLRRLFAHKTIGADRVGQSLTKVFENRVSSTVFRFLMVLNRKGRLDQIGSIRQAFEQMLKRDRGEVDVEVYTAQPLSASQVAAVAARISTAIGKTAIVQTHTDPSLIGGLRIRVGDRLIDGSVATRLRRLGRQLADKGHELARVAPESLLSETVQP
ncbi:MAG: ATP synthase F1 subunit delta [Phycisphaerae bacterium]|nr:ATP synthase F1 subunit delta [Phycisphaerae bacterium]